MFKLNKEFLILILIFLLGFFLRFYKLGEFPIQLNHDEVTQLYDAISVAQTGKDIYGNFLPTIFTSVNDYKSPFYTYITVLTYFLLGGGEITIRVPAAIFGSLNIFAVYFFVTRLLKNNRIALVASFFTAIAPFEIFFSRKSFENGAGIFLMLLGFSLLLSKKAVNLYFGFGLLALAMHTYFSHVLIIPLLTASFILIFRNQRIYRPLLIWLFLLIPLILIILTNPTAQYRAKDVFLTQDPALGELIQFVKQENSQIIFIQQELVVIKYSFNRFLDQFNPAFLFVNGLDLTNQGLIDIGPLYLFQLPFFILGLIYLIKLRNFSNAKKFILVWIILGTIPSALTFEAHSPHRSIMVFTMLNIISACGFLFIFDALKEKKFNFFRYPLYLLIPVLIVLNFGFFLIIYFVNYPREKSQDLQYPFKEVSLFIWSNYNNFNQIIFDPEYGDISPRIGTGAHYYLAYYGKFDPSKFQKEYKLGKRQREVLFDKFSIRKLDWGEDKKAKKTLIIASSWGIPIKSVEKNKIIKTFYFYNKEPAFYAIKL